MRAVAQRKRSHWICCDMDGFLREAQQLAVDETCSYSTFTNRLTFVQSKYDTKLSCAERRKRRMPLELRTLSFRLRHAATLSDREALQQLLWNRKRRWIADLQAKAAAAKVRSGSVVKKTKKLHCIHGIVEESGNVLRTPDECADAIAQAFRAKWSIGKAEQRLQLLDFMFASERITPDFSLDEVASALRKCKKKDRLDCENVSVRAIELLFLAQPVGVASFLNSLASDTAEMSGLTCRGCPAGKDSSIPSVSNVRLLLPQGAVLSLLDII